LLIGRGEQARLRLDDIRASRLHCRIELGARGLEVVDQGSANGTFLNGQLVMRSPVKDGDELRVGDSMLRLKLELPGGGSREDEKSEDVFGREFACRECGRSISLETFAEGDVLEFADRFICPKCAQLASLLEPGGAVEAAICEQLAHDGFTDLERLSVPGVVPLFRARRAGLGQPVAIKAIASGRGTREKQVQRFLREARIVAQLSHPNIVQIFDVRRSGAIIYIVMEALEGLSLLQEIEARRRIDVRRALAIALSITRGLVHAHALGIVHRDLKPANVMVTDEGAVKLIDFGLAKMLTKDMSITQPGEALGTLAYAAPEQLRDAAIVDARADIFSLGATIYHMLAGRPPFGGLRGHELPALPVESGAADPLDAHVDGLPKEVLRLVERAMARKPEDRFPTAAEALAAIEDAIRTVHGFARGQGNVDVLVHFGPDEVARDETRKISKFGAPPKGSPLPASGFFGLFTQTELFELFQMVAQNQKSGQLEISDPPGRQGTVTFREGKVLAASYRERGGEKALYALLALDEGHFRFLSQPVEESAAGGAPPIAIAPVLLEAMRRRDERSRSKGSETMH
jgi:serine/threonine protein kinase